MTRAAILLAALSLLAACSAEPSAPEAATRAQPAPGAAAARSRDDERNNLAALTNGASVVSRTAESDLEQSAVHAIDSARFTGWMSPTGDPNVSVVLSLATHSRIERLGVVPFEHPARTPGRIRFELSPDGVSWREALILEPVPGSPSIQSIAPAEATYLRVTLVEPAEQVAQIRSIVAEGQPLAPPPSPRFAGCWTLNTLDAAIAVEGARLHGLVDDDPGMFLDGGIEGRVARLMWFRGPMWGYALATTSADGNAFSMATIHEEILLGSFGRAWMGTRCDGTRQPADAPAVSRMLDVAGRWSMFGLVFDGDALVENASTQTIDALIDYLRSSQGRHRIVSREFREEAAEANQKRADARLASLRAVLASRGADLSRLELTAAGSRSDVIESDHAIMRMLSSRIDLERVKSN